MSRRGGGLRRTSHRTAAPTVSTPAPMSVSPTMICPRPIELARVARAAAASAEIRQLAVRDHVQHHTRGAEREPDATEDERHRARDTALGGRGRGRRLGPGGGGRERGRDEPVLLAEVDDHLRLDVGVASTLEAEHALARRHLDGLAGQAFLHEAAVDVEANVGQIGAGSIARAEDHGRDRAVDLSQPPGAIAPDEPGASARAARAQRLARFDELPREPPPLTGFVRHDALGLRRAGPRGIAATPRLCSRTGAAAERRSEEGQGGRSNHKHSGRTCQTPDASSV